jgi:hypothetical protein
MIWLPRPDWDQFMDLFEKVEGTNWYDTREVALGILGRLSPECELEARDSKENITTILMVISMALEKVIPRKGGPSVEGA